MLGNHHNKSNKLLFFESLFYSKYYVRCFICILLFNTHNNPKNQVPLTLSCRWGNKSTERSIYLPKVTQPGSGQIGRRPVSPGPSLCLFRVLTCFLHLSLEGDDRQVLTLGTRFAQGNTPSSLEPVGKFLQRIRICHQEVTRLHTNSGRMEAKLTWVSEGFFLESCVLSRSVPPYCNVWGAQVSLRLQRLWTFPPANRRLLGDHCMQHGMGHPPGDPSQRLITFLHSRNFLFPISLPDSLRTESISVEGETRSCIPGPLLK